MYNPRFPLAETLQIHFHLHFAELGDSGLCDSSVSRSTQPSVPRHLGHDSPSPLSLRKWMNKNEWTRCMHFWCRNRWMCSRNQTATCLFYHTLRMKLFPSCSMLGTPTIHQRTGLVRLRCQLSLYVTFMCAKYWELRWITTLSHTCGSTCSCSAQGPNAPWPMDAAKCSRSENSCGVSPGKSVMLAQEQENHCHLSLCRKNSATKCWHSAKT